MNLQIKGNVIRCINSPACLGNWNLFEIKDLVHMICLDKQKNLDLDLIQFQDIQI